MSLLGSPTSLIPVSYRFHKRKSVGRRRYSCLLELIISSVLKLHGKCNTARFSFPLSRRSSKELRGQFFDKMPSPWVLFQYQMRFGMQDSLIQSRLIFSTCVLLPHCMFILAQVSCEVAQRSFGARNINIQSNEFL